MEYRYPRWISYVLLGFMVPVIAVAVYAIDTSIAHPGAGADIAFGVVGICIMALLGWVYLYVRRYSFQIGPECVNITGVLRTRSIPFSMINQVVTAAAPRSGTDSWLIDGNDAIITKIDGGLVGFDSLLMNLGKALQPYQVLFYRRENFVRWEMQVAGDSHWVPYEAPSIARKSGRRLMYAIAFGCLIFAIALALLSLTHLGILAAF
ncbi:YdbT family protein [Dyella flagellata]|uniref:PH domain-containing protein n=1 Tax=Dyella flagellata TaxID=1867833 RepID=A0ABQ5XKD6_9GAMM|nr:hypothetical protein [Dyella flagellata]GLQ90973.1 hypothetical protein GCM10007898_45490 [Dyella flagellata]